MPFKNCFGGGGVDINGIVEQYKVAAGNTISAGDFVEFIQERCNPIVKSSTSFTSRSTSGNFICSVKLDTNRVFVLAPSSSATTLSAYIINISSDRKSISKIAECIVSSYQYSSNNFVATLVDSTHILIVYPDKYSDGRSYVYGVVATIIGNTITIGASCVLTYVDPNGYTSDSDRYLSNIISLGNNRFLFCHNYGASGKGSTMEDIIWDYRLVGTIVYVNGNTVSRVSETILSSCYLSGYMPGTHGFLAKISDNKALVAYHYSSDDHATSGDTRGAIITIGSSYDLSMGTMSQIPIACGANYSKPHLLILDSLNAALISADTNYSLSYTPVTISQGNTISTGTSTILGKGKNCQIFACDVSTANGRILVYYSNEYYNGNVISISLAGTEIIQIKETQKCIPYATVDPRSVLIVDNIHALVVVNHGNTLHAYTVTDSESVVKKSAGVVHGVSQSDGTGGSIIKITVPSAT